MNSAVTGNDIASALKRDHGAGKETKFVPQFGGNGHLAPIIDAAVSVHVLSIASVGPEFC
jgi:hypothetical protein